MKNLANWPFSLLAWCQIIAQFSFHTMTELKKKSQYFGLGLIKGVVHQIFWGRELLQTLQLSPSIQTMWLEICCWCSKGQGEKKKRHLKKLWSRWLPSGELTDAPVNSHWEATPSHSRILTKAVYSDAYWLCWVNMGLFLSTLTLYAPPTKAILDLLAPVKWLVTGHYIRRFQSHC